MSKLAVSYGTDQIYCFALVAAYGYFLLLPLHRKGCFYDIFQYSNPIYVYP